MVSCLMGDSTALASAIVRCCLNFNVCESRTAVINRLFYLVPDYYGAKLRVFIFYEENTFIKEKDGDLRLIQSELKIQ